METILDKEKMDAVKALADTNMKVSEAKASLALIKADEGKYLAGREKKALELVERVLEESSLLLREARGNYEQVKDLHKGAGAFAEELSAAQRGLSEAVKGLETAGAEFELRAEILRKEVEAARQEVKTDQVRLKNDRESLQRERDALSRESRIVADERQAIDRAISRLKQGKI